MNFRTRGIGALSTTDMAWHPLARKVQRWAGFAIVAMGAGISCSAVAGLFGA